VYREFSWFSRRPVHPFVRLIDDVPVVRRRRAILWYIYDLAKMAAAIPYMLVAWEGSPTKPTKFNVVKV
jgi:hypothetical protein